MSRPKANNKRRIIVDLSYPQGQSVNSAVCKGLAFGKYISHCLPIVEQALHHSRSLGFDASAGVIYIERTYRNFRPDPLDCPLLMVSMAEGSFYVDLALPFGARLSSLYVQQLAEFIMGVLRLKGIIGLVYLNDVFLLFPNHLDADVQFAEAMNIVCSLGLPINYTKLLPPKTQAIWLGVLFNFDTKYTGLDKTQKLGLTWKWSGPQKVWKHFILISDVCSLAGKS